MLMRSRANQVRPFTIFESQLDAHWNTLANSTKSNIQVRTLEKGSNYDVKSTITNAVGEVAASGQYNSVSGLHAEMAALENCPPLNGGILSVNPAPCKRCAAVLAYYRTNHEFTIHAPERAFAATYAGAYHLPEFIKEDVIIGGVVRKGIMSQVEALHHKQAVLSRFCSHSW